MNYEFKRRKNYMLQIMTTALNQWEITGNNDTCPVTHVQIKDQEFFSFLRLKKMKVIALASVAQLVSWLKRHPIP